MFQLREKTGSNRGLTGKKTSEAPYSLRLDMFGKSQHSYNSFNMILKNSTVDNSIKYSNLEWCTHKIKTKNNSITQMFMDMNAYCCDICHIITFI